MGLGGGWGGDAKRREDPVTPACDSGGLAPTRGGGREAVYTGGCGRLRSAVGQLPHPVTFAFVPVGYAPDRDAQPGLGPLQGTSADSVFRCEAIDVD